MKTGKPTEHRAGGWYAESRVPSPERPPLTIDLDVDVCVIGAGLAGLTAAREIARRGWSVAVLEAGCVGCGASGRNCGFVLPGFAEDIDRIIERVGLQQAKALWALSERGLEYVRKTIRETKMPGVAPVDGWLYVAKFRHDPAMEASATLLRDEFGTQVEAWSAGRVRDLLKSPFYRNGVHFPRAFNIHPLNYTLGLATAAERAGARIFEYTPALSIDPTGIRKRITTPSARVRSAHVVLAGSTGIGALMPRLGASLLPITTYVATTAPLGPQLAEAVRYSGAVSDTPSADNHYRIIGGDRLLWAGGVTLWAGDARRFASRLAMDIRRTFPQLRDVKIDHVWSGTLGRAVHSMPQVGELSRGLWLASGFGGHGFNTTAMAGELVARGVVEGDQTWRLFSAYDLVWAGGAFGRAAAQVLYWTRRIRDLADASMAAKVETQSVPPPNVAAPDLAAEAPSAPAVAAAPLAAPVETDSAGAEAIGKSSAKKSAPPRKRRKKRKTGANGAKGATDIPEMAGEADSEASSSTQEMPADRSQ